jgi:hypothetical protein
MFIDAARATSESSLAMRAPLGQTLPGRLHAGPQASWSIVPHLICESPEMSRRVADLSPIIAEIRASGATRPNGSGSSSTQMGM